MEVAKAAAAGRTAAAFQKEQAKNAGSPSLAEMMKDAREKIQAHKDSLKISKNPKRYGDVPIEAYSRLSRAKNTAQVSAAAGYARRQIFQLKAAKQRDPEHAKQIQAAINQLQKAVTRSGKKKRELEQERADEKRQARLREEARTREAQRQQTELRRKRSLRAVRESGYIREAAVDQRVQNHLAATQTELRNQAQALSAALQPPAGTAEQYPAPAAEAAPPSGGTIDVQA